MRTQYSVSAAKPAKKLPRSAGAVSSTTGSSRRGGGGGGAMQRQAAQSDDMPQEIEHYYVRHQNKKIEITDKSNNAVMAIIVFLWLNKHHQNKFVHACREAVLGPQARMYGRN